MRQFMAFICVFVSVGFLNGAPGLAQGQVEIVGDSFVISETKNTATFTGNVVIKQSGLTVWADKVVILYGAGGASDIETLKAIGHVRIETETQMVTGDTGEYDPQARVMRVVGNVVTTNESGTVKGPELLVNFATNTTEFVQQNGNRVTGVFNQ